MCGCKLRRPGKLSNGVPWLCVPTSRSVCLCRFAVRPRLITDGSIAFSRSRTTPSQIVCKYARTRLSGKVRSASFSGSAAYRWRRCTFVVSVLGKSRLGAQSRFPGRGCEIELHEQTKEIRWSPVLANHVAVVTKISFRAATSAGLGAASQRSKRPTGMRTSSIVLTKGITTIFSSRSKRLSRPTCTGSTRRS
jgi:hypothetical protein